MATKTKKRPRANSSRGTARRRAKAKPSTGDTDVAITEDRLVNAKEAERHLNDARLTFEELKAKYGAAKAEHKLLTAKRNRIISTATTVDEVEEAQRDVTNARRRMNTAKDAASSAKDDLKGWEETLQKALSGEQPLFEELKQEIHNELEERGILAEE